MLIVHKEFDDRSDSHYRIDYTSLQHYQQYDKHTHTHTHTHTQKRCSNHHITVSILYYHLRL